MASIKDYLDREIYSVETDYNGDKQIHVFGFCYDHDDEYRCVEAAGCYVPLSDIEKDREHAGDIIYDAFCESKQYEGTVTEDKVLDYYKGYKSLHVSNVTKDTPNGMYIN